MKDFKLDERLQQDCFILRESEKFLILLLNNALYPWFIVVPKTDKTELYELDNALQLQVLDIINQLSMHIMSEFKPDKLNVAAIGNIVQQMHIHIVGRSQTDPCWPGVVWGAADKQQYKPAEVEKIKLILNSVLEL